MKKGERFRLNAQGHIADRSIVRYEGELEPYYDPNGVASMYGIKLHVVHVISSYPTCQRVLYVTASQLMPA